MKAQILTCVYRGIADMFDMSERRRENWPKAWR